MINKYLKAFTLILMSTSLLPTSAYGFCLEQVGSFSSRQLDTRALYHQGQIAGLDACIHTDGYAVKFMDEFATKDEAVESCEALNQVDTQYKWFLPAAGDLANLVGGSNMIGYFLAKESLKRQAAGKKPIDYVWYRSVPVTADFTFQVRQELDKVDRLIPSNRSPQLLTQVVGDRNTVLRLMASDTAKLPHFCMTKTNAIDKKSLQEAANFKPVQIKGRVIKKNGIHLIATSQDRYQAMHAYKPDGSGIVYGGIITKGSEATAGNTSRDALYFGYDMHPILADTEIRAVYPDKPLVIIPESSGIKSAIESLSEDENVLIRGELAPRSRMLRVSSITPLGIESEYRFSFCQAETKHFRSTKQGCAYFSDPNTDQGVILLGLNAKDLHNDPSQLKTARASFGLRGFLVSEFEKEDRLFGSRLDVTFAKVEEQFRGNPNVTCNSELNAAFVGFSKESCSIGGFFPETVLGNNQLAKEFFPENQGAFTKELSVISAFKGAQVYHQYFPKKTFSSPVNFRYAQRETLEKLRTLEEEMALALTAPSPVQARSGISLSQQKFAEPYSTGRFRVFIPKLGNLVTSNLKALPRFRSQGSSPNSTRVFIPAASPSDLEQGKILMQDSANGNVEFGDAKFEYTFTKTLKPAESTTAAPAPFIPREIYIETVTQEHFDRSGPNVPDFLVINAAVTVLISNSMTLAKRESQKATPIDEQNENTAEDDCQPYQAVRGPVKHDVNGDGKVTAADALMVINELGRRTIGSSDGACPQTKFMDVNNDGRLSASDALSVINELARRSIQ